MNKEKEYFISEQLIYLREVRESDVNENYYNWINSTEINQYLETRYFPRSYENIISHVKNLDGQSNEIFFAICDKETDNHIGNIKLGPINWVHGFADISLLIGDKKFWGKGIGTQAIKAVCNFAFNTLNLHKLKAGCYERNIGSSKAFEKAGFLKEGVLKKQWKLNGEFCDQIIYGLCVEDVYINN
jgi:ribosomal-protein-alanine N-acetyltransferase